MEKWYLIQFRALIKVYSSIFQVSVFVVAYI